MSKKNEKKEQENGELQSKMVEFLKTQTAPAKTTDLIKALGLLNVGRHRNLVRRLARESKEIIIKTVNRQLNFSYKIVLKIKPVTNQPRVGE